MVTKSVLITKPTTEVVSLARVKDFLRIDSTDDDVLLAVQIRTATQRLEALCDVKFCSQTWAVYFDSFGCKRRNQWWDGSRDMAVTELNDYGTGSLKLPFGPIQSVTGVYTYDENDTEYEFAASNYQADLIGRTPSINLKLGATWPSTILRPVNGIKVQGVFGYGLGVDMDAAASVDNENIPEPIQEAVKQFAAYLYEHRGDELPKVPPNVSLLIEPYRKVKV